MPEVAGVPVLVLGTGQRCGSTLMQRLLTSHPDAFIWGEHQGHLETVLDAVEKMIDYSVNIGIYGRRDFAEAGYQSFIANMMPAPEHVEEAFRDFVARAFIRPLEAQGKRVWGFKEVRFDRDFAKRLRRFFPELRVIFIVRDPRAILSSIHEWVTKGYPRDAPERIMSNWRRIATSFRDAENSADPPVLKLRYEDYTADPERTCQLVGEFTGLDPALFDRAVFARRIHMHGVKGEGVRPLRAFADLPADMRGLLDDEVIVRTAAAYGYDLVSVAASRTATA